MWLSLPPKVHNVSYSKMFARKGQRGPCSAIVHCVGACTVHGGYSDSSVVGRDAKVSRNHRDGRLATDMLMMRSSYVLGGGGAAMGTPVKKQKLGCGCVSKREGGAAARNNGKKPIGPYRGPNNVAK